MVQIVGQVVRMMNNNPAKMVFTSNSVDKDARRLDEVKQDIASVGRSRSTMNQES